ncbi:TIGR02117 family protein [Cesiribacter andamanensis]|uniref:Urease-associated protein n=1 Tax=Cesiribacter andamanensis AMV16 TaxID=1279009 RepID=M7N977_9BACT|nr:TIGR02117 family protein [Cesiribacter andamanensis]EMR03797.1 hypothetical protein ADICEAN_01038 [Cesiribacter andamanensis AMV16]
MLRRLFRYFYVLLLSLLALLLLFVGLAWLLALLPANADAHPQSEGVAVYITTNGVHADFRVPVQTEVIDWRQLLPLRDYTGADSRFRYVAFGWGDQGFYLHTPQWSDLTPGTAARALFMPSPTAMHVTYYPHAPATGKDSRRLYLSPEQYRQLVAYIQQSFARTASGELLLIPGAGYSPYDNFYEARGSYTLFYTCNNWVNEGLQKIGVKTARWAPFDWGVMYHLEE